MTNCPYCNNISESNKICNHCGESLEIQCPYCKEVISVNDRVCPYCNSKLRSNSISALIKITYVLLFLNAMIPYWFANSINKHPVFWHKIIEKNDDFYDLISLVIGIAIMSSIPSTIGLILDYRKRICTISLIAFLLLCICNIHLIFRI